MVQAVNPYLNFAGNTLDAFEFYRSVFGGEVEVGVDGLDHGFISSVADGIACGRRTRARGFDNAGGGHSRGGAATGAMPTGRSRASCSATAGKAECVPGAAGSIPVAKKATPVPATGSSHRPERRP